MKWFKIFAGAVALVVIAGLYIQRKTTEAHDLVAGLCKTTRTGELWPQVQARGAQRDLHFEKVSRSAQTPEEFLTSHQAMGKRYGCVVRVKDGRVVDTRFNDLPPQ